MAALAKEINLSPSLNNKTEKEIINMAINSTLSRTVITSLLTMVVVLILFLFGGSSIRGFAFALVVGIIVGTYSSIFIAAPVVYDLAKSLKSESKAEKKIVYQDKVF